MNGQIFPPSQGRDRWRGDALRCDARGDDPETGMNAKGPPGQQMLDDARARIARHAAWR